MSSPIVTSSTNLILGCGYLGRRVAARWLTAGLPVAALTRGDGSALRAIGVKAITGNVLVPASLRFPETVDTVLYAIGFDRAAGATMSDVYISGLKHVLDTLPVCRQFIYVSSTGVYGQSDGSRVDETSTTEPVEQSGQIVLRAEELLREERPDAIILRFAGIYGPDRLLRRQAIKAGQPLVGDADRRLNLIHVDDGVEAVLATVSRGQPGETYNIADDAAPTRREFYTLLAELLNGPPAQFVAQAEEGQPNRIVSNLKARLALGWQPRYPTFHEGLPAAVSASAPS